MLTMKLLALAFWSLLFLFFTGVAGGSWFALIAFIAVVVYRVTDTARKAAAVTRTARQLEQARCQEERAIAESCTINKLTPKAVALFTNPN
jgi:hypothetical protein